MEDNSTSHYGLIGFLLLFVVPISIYAYYTIKKFGSYEHKLKSISKVLNLKLKTLESEGTLRSWLISGAFRGHEVEILCESADSNGEVVEITDITMHLASGSRTINHQNDTPGIFPDIKKQVHSSDLQLALDNCSKFDATFNYGPRHLEYRIPYIMTDVAGYNKYLEKLSATADVVESDSLKKA